MTLRTTCPYCGVGCGVSVAKDGTLAGDTAHPANFGRLCSKGVALAETLHDRERLLQPTIDGGAVSWDEAAALVAERFLQTVADHGPESVAFYLSGQLLTEDYYVANKLAKGYLGTANVDTNSRLCMASAVAAHVRAFGEDIVPGCYEDLDETDLAIMVGSNMAWCHPILYRRLMDARERRGTKIVVIDPRRTATCETADLHLSLKAGTDTVLFNGLLVFLAGRDALDQSWIKAHTDGFEEALRAARASAPSIEDVAMICDISVDDVRRFYEMFAHTKRVVTLTSQGVNQSASGTDKFNAIINCHLATGRIGRPGMGPFSLTGQPNAMGGREVGGLANQLAAHMAFTSADVDRVRRFWNAPRIADKAGLKAVDMFEAVNDGRIKAIWIMATNPADSMPRAGMVREALAKCPFVVVSDCWPTDTTDLAHVVLPAAGWSEKGGTVTNSERRISRQRAFRDPPGEARPDWRIVCDVAAKMGFGEAFSYHAEADIFREHARLSAFENEGARLFDLGSLASMSDKAFEALAPVQWGSKRFFGNGAFPTLDGKARFVPTSTTVPQPAMRYPLRLNTGRIRDQWHTMTRTGSVPRLMRHTSEPLLEIHPNTASTRKVSDGTLVRVTSAHGSVVSRAKINAGQRRDEVFLPMHWTDRYVSSGPADKLVHALVDPVSGQPDLKATPVEIDSVAACWHGVLLTQPDANPEKLEGAYWARIPLEGCQAIEYTGYTPLVVAAFADGTMKRVLGVDADLVIFADPGRRSFRFAAVRNGTLMACLFLEPSANSVPARSALAGLLGKPCSGPEAQMLLALTQAAPLARTVCSCFGVSVEEVRARIASQSLTTVADIGRILRAGTNCGSCIPELKVLLADANGKQRCMDRSTV